ncbi:MAG: class I SAM-dependent methyltransferase [Candidatus Scalindua sp.]|nr:class I SAM-dependent methyltransferase [Candidatus Scalindua sp.]
MKEYSSPLKIDYDSKYDDRPRTELLQMVTETPQRVFEIGCGSGATGYALKQKFQGLEFTGLEPDEKAARIAENRLDKIIVSDIEKVHLEAYGIKKEYFDLIICADVLEHLYDPWKTLFILRDYLKPHGKILASIPNTQYINLIINLLNGHWTYEKHGLLDATHLRFFTLNEIKKMFTGSGYKIVRCSFAEQPRLENIQWPADLDFGKIVLKNITREEATRLFVIQYFIIAQKVVS